MRVSRSAGVATSSVLAAGTLASLTTGCAAVIVRRPRVAAGTGSSSRSNRLQHAHVPFRLLPGHFDSLARGSPGFRDVGGPGEYVASRIFVLVGEFGFHRCIVFPLQPAFCAFEYIRRLIPRLKKKARNGRSGPRYSGVRPKRGEGRTPVDMLHPCGREFRAVAHIPRGILAIVSQHIPSGL